jgi:Fe2+ transport system protein B
MIAGLIERIKEYVKLKIEQIKLELVGHVARLMSHLIVVMLLIIFGLFMVFFLSFAVGALLNELMESSYLGFLIMAGAYFLGFVILVMLAKSGRIQGWIETAIIKASDQIEEDE